MTFNPSYLSFFKKQWRFLSFGLFLTFASSFGQTFFIALFGDQLRETFQLSHSQFGLAYSLATLASACTIIWFGSFIDRLPLKTYTTLVAWGLGGACFLMGNAHYFFMLPVAIYGLRLTGQGLMSHISTTSMGRYFHHNRGKAVSIASFGHPLGESFLPLTAVSLLLILDWRQVWMVIGAFVIAIVWPASLWLMKGHELTTEDIPEASAQKAKPEVVSKSHKQVLKEASFYILLPAILAPAFVNTGVFFHQNYIASSHGLAPTAFAGGFVFYATATFLAALFAGWVVDKIGATRLAPLFLVPLSLGLIILGTAPSLAGIYTYMILSGITMGLYVTVSGAIWPELYGVSHLGSIRSMVTALMVFSTSASPYLFGVLIDAHVSLVTILVGTCIYTIVASLLTLYVTAKVKGGQNESPGQSR